MTEWNRTQKGNDQEGNRRRNRKRGDQLRIRITISTRSVTSSERESADSFSGSRMEVCTFSGSGGGTSHLFRRSLVEEISGIRIRARANYQRFVLQIVRQNQLIFAQAGSVSARIGAEISSKIRKKTNDQELILQKGMEKSIYNICP